MQCVYYSWDQVLNQYCNVEWLLLFKRHSVFFYRFMPTEYLASLFFTGTCVLRSRISLLGQEFTWCWKCKPQSIFRHKNVCSIKDLNKRVCFFDIYAHYLTSVKSPYPFSLLLALYLLSEWAYTAQWVSNFTFEFQLLDEHQVSSPDNGI